MNLAKTSGIYCIRNTVSGRVYVGSAKSIANRWHGHLSLLRRGLHHAPILQKSWSLHGESAFVFEVLEVVEKLESLVPREQHWIDTLNSASPKTGFNASPTAGSPLGSRRTPEQKEALSRLATGKKKSPEHIEKMRSVHIGAKRSAESKAKMSAIHKGKTISKEHRAQISAAFKGRTLTAETIAKMRESRRLTMERKRAERTATHIPIR